MTRNILTVLALVSAFALSGCYYYGPPPGYYHPYRHPGYYW